MALYSSLVGVALLRPVIGLNLWTFTMEAWMYAYRIPAIGKYKVKLGPNSTKEDMNSQLPPSVRWPADNYNHLQGKSISSCGTTTTDNSVEQPTQFYAVALTLALLGVDDGTTLALAWGYVGVRVVHSLVQALTNTIMVRFSLFAASSALLLAMTVRAATLLF